MNDASAPDRKKQALELSRVVLCHGPHGRRRLSDEIVRAMEAPDLTLAGELALILAEFERGWSVSDGGEPLPAVDGARLSLGKLRHDLHQFEHLRRSSVGGAPLEELIAAYRAAIRRLAPFGETARVPLGVEDEPLVARAYGRLVHLAEAPRVDRALSPHWDRRAAERRYLEQRPSVVVIDDFLSAHALEGLLRFCRDSTIWAGNRYANGRLSALFFTGFNAPLILQIAEEIRDAFPVLIGDRHPLRQMWAFKNTQVLPPQSTIHADFAAINVNFWITPDEANLEPESGGMVVYDLEAPLSWSFQQYNEQPALIRELMARRRPRAVRIPYRQNRAVIFNSDLFHATEAVCFRPDYLSCRINVTMLYGDRVRDELHAEPELQLQMAARRPLGAWRSRALTRRR